MKNAIDFVRFALSHAKMQKIADLHIGMPVQRQTGIVIVIEKQLPRDSGVVHLII